MSQDTPPVEFEKILANKCDEIHTHGLDALRRGIISPFDGFPKEVHKRFNASVKFGPTSRMKFRMHVSHPLLEIADDLQANLFCAGRDFHIHSTLEEVDHDGCECEILAAIASVGLNDLVGEELVFSELLLDGSNVLLNSLEIPPKHRQVRLNLDNEFAKFGKPRPIHDLLHITVARIMTLPFDLNHYVDRVLKLRQIIKSTPVVIRVASIHLGSPTPLLQAP